MATATDDRFRTLFRATIWLLFVTAVSFPGRTAAANDDNAKRTLAQKEAQRRIVKLNGFFENTFPTNNFGTPSPPSDSIQTVALGDAQQGQQRIVDSDLELLLLLPDLKALFLFRTDVTDNGLAVLARLQKLHNLQLYHNSRITPAGLEHLKNLQHLHTIELYGNAFDDSGLRHVSKVTNLKELICSSRSTTDQGMRHLAQMEQLQMLSLSGTEITDEGIMRLAVLRQLKSLSLWRTQVTPEGVARLRKELPKCDIKLNGAEKVIREQRIARPRKPRIDMTRQRPDNEIGRLLDKLEQQNAGDERFHDPWLRTLQQIVELGEQAVPELVIELDATDNDMMLRCLGFTLRAMGDPRAVPALVRSLPKTLRPPGSDMGLRAEDPQLVKFAQEHDLDEEAEGTRYGFGRPIREIAGALQKLTGQKLGEEELFHTFLDGVERQQRMRQLLFYRTAKRWADWWEQNAKQFTPDPAYAKVNLKELAVQPIDPRKLTARYKTDSGGSNWLLESVLNPESEKCFYDFDTGRVAALPEKWRSAKDIESHLEAIVAWAAEEGFDWMGTEYEDEDTRRHFALQGIGLQAWELGEHRWKMSANDITLKTLQDEGTPARSLLLHYDKEKERIDPEAIASYFFFTREGSPGLLFVGVQVHDDSLKPGGVFDGDNELRGIAFDKGRKFGFKHFEEVR